MLSLMEALDRYRRRVIHRLRGEPDLDRLVAEGMRLGHHTHIADSVYFDRLHPWLITIGDYVAIGPYAALITHDATLNQHTGRTRLGCVVIGRRVNVGVGAILLPGTTIGEDSVVGAGAVVSGEVPPGSLVTGNPATISPIKAVAAWHRATARRAPNWPREGWTRFSGISEARKLEQREALAGGASGYVPAGYAPDSPHALREQHSAASST